MATLQVVKYGVRRLMRTEECIADNFRRRPFKTTDITLASIVLLIKFRKRCDYTPGSGEGS